MRAKQCGQHFTPHHPICVLPLNVLPPTGRLEIPMMCCRSLLVCACKQEAQLLRASPPVMCHADRTGLSEQQLVISTFFSYCAVFNNKYTVIFKKVAKFILLYFALPHMPRACANNY